jgi:hypothetical protein
MEFLKTKDVTYSLDKKAYDKYFRSFADQTRVYVASEEERAADAAASRCDAAASRRDAACFSVGCRLPLAVGCRLLSFGWNGG